MTRDLTEGFIGPKLYRGQDGELNAERLNADMDRLQAQLNFFLDRLGGSALLGPPPTRRPPPTMPDGPVSIFLQGEIQLTVTSNSNWIIPHTLGRVPLGWVVAGVDGPVQIFNGSSAWTDTVFSLESDRNGRNLTVWVF